MNHVEQLRHLGGVLRRYYAPEFREPLSEDLLRLATALEKRLRTVEISRVEGRAAQARQKRVKLKLVWPVPDSGCEHFTNT